MIRDSTQDPMGNKEEDSTWVEQEDSSPRTRKFPYCHILNMISSGSDFPRQVETLIHLNLGN